MNEAEKQLHEQIMAETQAKLQQQMDNNKVELSADFTPFNGISMEQWASINAGLTQGQSLENMISALGMDLMAWDNVNTEWNARMSRDTTATIASIYGQAFMASNTGQLSGVADNVSASMVNGIGAEVDGDEPVSFEQWIKITEHMNAAAAQGNDTVKLLEQYQMSAVDWGTIGGYWGQKMNNDPLTYLDDYQRLQTKYSAEFA